jgi:hypothetical protein
MNLTLDVRQGEALDALLDRAMNGGICFAITTQWAFLLLHGTPYETETLTWQTFIKSSGKGGFTKMTEGPANVRVQKGFFSLVSLQRGYDLVDLRLADKMSAAQQDSFFKTASEFSEKFLRSQCRTEGFTLQPMAVFKTADQVADSLSLGDGTVELIGIFGVEDGKNWGHIVGAAKQGAYLFFDANAGQYNGSAGDIKTDISSHLKSYYDGIQNCAKYTISK